MVAGSVASICYGEPRMTHDVDLVLMLLGDNVADLEKAFPSDEYYLPPLEANAYDPKNHLGLLHGDRD